MDRKDDTQARCAALHSTLANMERELKRHAACDAVLFAEMRTLIQEGQKQDMQEGLDTLSLRIAEAERELKHRDVCDAALFAEVRTLIQEIKGPDPEEEAAPAP